MNTPSRRSLLLGGAGAAAGAAALLAGVPAGAGTDEYDNEYLWGFSGTNFSVPSHTWTPVPFPLMLLNTSTVRLDPDRCTWVFPAETAAGIWAIVANIAWDNARAPDGSPIKPPTHRKLVRMPQQDVGTPQIDQVAITGSQSEAIYHADLAATGDHGFLADGTRGYQEQQVYIQAGVRKGKPDQRFWIEVYQDSGMTLSCPVDGSVAPKTATRPAMWAWQAPSFMAVKVCDY